MTTLFQAREETPGSGQSEIVVGKLQMAALLFVATVVLAVFSAVSYLAGKIVSGKPQPEPAAVAPVEPLGPPPPIFQEQPPTPPAKTEAPLFAEPKPGAIYLQMGAVEKGIGVVFADGLRKHGLAAFVAPGPNEKIFRVLIGPLPDREAFDRAKETIDRIGIASFARRYQQ